MAKTITFISILIIILATYLGILIFSSDSNFDPDKVNLKLKGKKALSWGETGNYSLFITNQNRQNLQNISLQIKAPKNLKITSRRTTLDKIGKKSNQSFKFQLRAFGNKDQKQKIQTKISFQVGNTGASFSKKIQNTIKTKDDPLEIKVTEKEKKNLEENSQAQLEIKNKTDQSLPRIKVTLKDSQNFSQLSFSSTDKPKEWVKTDLPPEATSSVPIKATTENQEKLSFKTQTEIFFEQDNPLYQATKTLTFSPPSEPLTISQKFLNKEKEDFTPGEKFTLQTSLANNSSSTMKNLEAKIKLSGREFIKTNSLELEGEAKSNQATNQIIATSFSPLEAGTELEYKLSFQTKDNIPIVDQNQEAQISLATELNCNPEDKKTELTVSGHEKLKIKTNLEIHSQFNHIAGPNPPSPEEESTYKVTWKLLNSYNDIKNLKVTTVLPERVQWQENSNSNKENLNFDQEKRKIIWKIDTVPPGTGWLSPIKEKSFKVALTPKSKKDQYFLTGETTAEGTDQFQNEQIKKFDSALTLDKNN